VGLLGILEMVVLYGEEELEELVGTGRVVFVHAQGEVMIAIGAMS